MKIQTAVNSHLQNMKCYKAIIHTEKVKYKIDFTILNLHDDTSQ